MTNPNCETCHGSGWRTEPPQANKIRPERMRCHCNLSVCAAHGDYPPSGECTCDSPKKILLKQDSAFPNQGLGIDGKPSHEPSFGLTKREYIAAMIMQGLVSNLAAIRRDGFYDTDLEHFALLRADALLNALAATQQ